MSKYPGLVRLLKDGHTYLVDGLNLDLGGHAPDAGRQEEQAQKRALYTPEKEEQRGNMPGKVDEAKWNAAKAKAQQSHPDWDEKNPRLWKIISTIYKSMGGTFSDEIKKSLAVISELETITPSFVLDPVLWLAALKKSGVDYREKSRIYGNLGLTMRCYAEMGGQLVKSSMLDVPLEKGGSHRYSEKVALPGGGFRYVYPEDKKGDDDKAPSGSGLRKPAPAEKTAAAEPKKAAQSTYAKTIEALSAKNDSDAKASLQNVNYEHLSGMHSEMKTSDPKRKLVAEAMAAKKQAAVREQAAAKEKSHETNKSQNDMKYDDFEKKNLSEVKASLRKSHPEWDSATLESRTKSQLRQLFKFQ